MAPNGVSGGVDRPGAAERRRSAGVLVGTAANAFSLEYQVNGQTFVLNYWFEGNTYTFECVDPAGGKRTETHTRR